MFTLLYCLLNLTYGECYVISLYFCVSLLVYLFVLCVAYLTVFVNCLVKQFAMCLGAVAILLLNVMDVFSVGGGALLDRPWRVCDPSMHLGVPSIGLFVFLYVKSYLLI